MICLPRDLVLWGGSRLPGTLVQATCGCERAAAPIAPTRRRLPRWPSDLRIPPLCDCAPNLSVATCTRWHMACSRLCDSNRAKLVVKQSERDWVDALSRLT